VGLTFAVAVRSVLRSDPDVILVGEIRDLETVNVAQQAALTGHLVLSTLHTAQAADALVRMVEMGAAPFVVADATRAIVAQRLVRVLCAKCKRPAVPSADLIAAAGQLARDGGLDWTRMEKHFHEPVGCPACRNLGFRGRTTMAEVFEVTPEIGAAVRRSAKAAELQAIAIRQGMTTLAADGVRRAAAGQTTVTEVLRVLGVK
jgi:type II secretory ATPase GspE/PulE/Tfp pilus assembly ATPase PilB-like protein